MRNLLAPLSLSLYLIGLSACSGAPEPTTHAGGTAGPSLDGATSEAASGVGHGPTATPMAAPASQMRTATTTPFPTSTVTSTPVPTVRVTRAPAPTAVITPTAIATPVPEQVQAPLTTKQTWVRDRLGAVVSIYGISSEGTEALGRLDLRWMQDNPGFFGSYGYRKWAGVGEAKPTGVMHELSHSYWGLFPISGLPQLGWDAPSGKDLSPAMERYHRDVVEFMGQPPDHFELLRSRLRYLPELSLENLEPLLHTMEADAIYSTAGDLQLIPPILRKYWDHLLQPGPFHSWAGAMGWYQALPPDDKVLVDIYLGFQHFDLRAYGGIEASEVAVDVDDIDETISREETQRLRDFVLLFDLLLGSPEHEEDFKFWRRYLSDKLSLNKRRPELVASLQLPRSREIASALDFLSGVEGQKADDKAGLVIEELDEQPFLVHFVPALDNFTLLKLFTSEARLPEGATLKGASAYVESLQKFAPDIDKVLEAARAETSRGAEELTSYLKTVDFEEKEELELFFEVLQGSDNAVAKEVVAALDNALLRRLLVPVPAKLRSLLKPGRLLEFLDVNLESSPEELAQGIEDMMTYPSGNYVIDEPFLDEMYQVVAARGRAAPKETLRAIASSPFPMERFIALQPLSAVDILASELDVTLGLVRASDTVIFPPARFIYRLIYADPEFAARVVLGLDAAGDDDVVVEALAHYAYDSDRLEDFPYQSISLERDARFLESLLKARGEEWLESRIGQAVGLYRQRVEDGEVSDDFLDAYEKTLRAATSALEDGNVRRSLERITRRAFR